jgi:hypothetical protein
MFCGEECTWLALVRNVGDSLQGRFHGEPCRKRKCRTQAEIDRDSGGLIRDVSKQWPVKPFVSHRAVRPHEPRRVKPRYFNFNVTARDALVRQNMCRFVNRTDTKVLRFRLH